MFAEAFAITQRYPVEETRKILRKEYLDGKHLVIDYGPVGWFDVFAAFPLRQASVPVEGLKKVYPASRVKFDVARGAVEIEGFGGVDVSDDSARFLATGARDRVMRGVEEATHRLIALGARKRRQVLVYADMQSRGINWVLGYGTTGGFANRDYQSTALSMHDAIQYPEWHVTSLIHEWAHVYLFNAPRHVKQAFLDYYRQKIVKAAVTAKQGMTKDLTPTDATLDAMGHTMANKLMYGGLIPGTADAAHPDNALESVSYMLRANALLNGKPLAAIKDDAALDALYFIMRDPLRNGVVGEEGHRVWGYYRKPPVTLRAQMSRYAAGHMESPEFAAAPAKLSVQKVLDNYGARIAEWGRKNSWPRWFARFASPSAIVQHIRERLGDLDDWADDMAKYVLQTLYADLSKDDPAYEHIWHALRGGDYVRAWLEYRLPDPDRWKMDDLAAVMSDVLRAALIGLKQQVPHFKPSDAVNKFGVPVMKQIDALQAVGKELDDLRKYIAAKGLTASDYGAGNVHELFATTVEYAATNPGKVPKTLRKMLQQTFGGGAVTIESKDNATLSPRKRAKLRAEDNATLSEARREEVDGIPLLYNPSRSELIGFANRHTELRGIATGPTDYVFWPSHAATHVQIAKRLGLTGTGDFTWFDSRSVVLNPADREQGYYGSGIPSMKNRINGQWVLQAADRTAPLRHFRIKPLLLSLAPKGGYGWLTPEPVAVAEVTEAAEDVDGVPCLVNPTATQLKGFIRRARYGEVRGLLSSDKDACYWDSDLATHLWIGERLGKEARLRAGSGSESRFYAELDGGRLVVRAAEDGVLALDDFHPQVQMLRRAGASFEGMDEAATTPFARFLKTRRIYGGRRPDAATLRPAILKGELRTMDQQRDWLADHMRKDGWTVDTDNSKSTESRYIIANKDGRSIKVRFSGHWNDRGASHYENKHLKVSFNPSSTGAALDTASRLLDVRDLIDDYGRAELTESLDEIADANKEVTWIKQRPDRWTAEFFVPSYPGHDRYTIDINADSYTPSSYGVIFAFEPEGRAPNFDTLDTGNAGMVFSYVISALREFVGKVKPKQILFSAKGRSRTSLYRALLRRAMRHLPQYALIPEERSEEDRAGVVMGIERVHESLDEAFTADPVLDADWMDKFRKDNRLLMSNVDRLLKPEATTAQYQTFVAGCKEWAESLKELVLTDLHNRSPLIDAFAAAAGVRPPNIGDDVHIRLLNPVRKTVWDYAATVQDVPGDYHTAQEGWDFALSMFRSGKYGQGKPLGALWKAKVGRAFTAATKALDAMIAAVRDSWGKSVSPKLKQVTQREEIAGFPAIIQASVGEQPRRVVAEALRRFRQRAGRVMPWLVQNFPALVLLHQADEWNYAGTYDRYRQELTIATRWADEPTRTLRTIVHEAGHHYYRRQTEAQRQLWEGLWQAQREPIDLKELLAVWHPGINLYAALNNLRDNPVNVQVEMAIEGDSSLLKGPLASREALEKFIAEGGQIKSPHFAASVYSGKSPEEGFCEALAEFITFGPRVLHPLARAMLSKWIGRDLRESKVEEDARGLDEMADGLKFQHFEDLMGRGQWNLTTVAYRGDNPKTGIVGYVDYTLYEDAVSISMVEVHKDARGQGVGVALIRAMLARLADFTGQKVKYRDVKWGWMTPDGMHLKRKCDRELRESEDNATLSPLAEAFAVSVG